MIVPPLKIVGVVGAVCVPEFLGENAGEEWENK